MHQNAPLPLPDKKSKKNFWGGAQPLPRPFPTGEGDTPSQTPTPLGAFGASFPLLLIYDSNTGVTYSEG